MRAFLACLLLVATVARAQPDAPAPAAAEPAAAAAPPAEAVTDLVASYELARTTAPSLIGAQAGLAASQARYRQTRGRLLPQLIGRGTYGHADEHVEGNLFGLTNVDRSYAYTSTIGTLTLTQELFDWGRFAEWEMADLRNRQAEMTLAAEEQALIVGVAVAYFGVLQAEDELRLADADLEALGEQLRQVQSRLKLGLSANAEVKEVEAKSDLGRAAQVTARNELDLRRAELQRLTGRWPGPLRPLAPDLKPEPPAGTQQEWTRRALEQNPAVRGARFGVDVAQTNVSRARGGWIPDVALEASALTLDNDDGITGPRTEEDLQARLVLTVPLYQGGQTAAAVAEAQELLRSAQANLDGTMRVVTQETTQHFLGLSASQPKVQAYAKALESTQAALEATRAGYRVGTRKSTDVLDALEDTLRAERDLAAARYEYVLNGLRLKAIAGELKADDLATANRLLQ